PYTIKLSLSSPINETGIIPFEACTVTILENDNNSEVLTEKEPGIYVTSEGGIQGVVGNNYSVSIITPEGKEYNTEPQEMKEPVAIDSVYAELLYLEEEAYPFGLPGYQFYIDTKTAPNQDNYFLWSMIETYQYTADYHLHSVFNGDSILYFSLGELPEYENLYRCWKTQNPGYIFTGKTSNLIVPKISQQPLHFVGTDSRRLQERYSLLLKQYSIDEDAYYFWESIEDQISQENFLVANQPYNIIGNIKNTNNPDETVFGYFTVASVTQKRIFVDRPNNAFYYEMCAIMSIPTLPPLFYVMLEEGDGGEVLESCIDCTFKGGVTTKPDFWIDK
ncbi:MAG: DUF4249 domain-containing protein, partial [Bacteroidales bacterium]|nr:DUF4249 domain-containing protein [Bacteroidales bacterium]